MKYQIGGLEFSANDIEHGCLRANSASPASIGSLLGIAALAQPQFPKGDPRLPLVRPLNPSKPWHPGTSGYLAPKDMVLNP